MASRDRQEIANGEDGDFELETVKIKSKDKSKADGQAAASEPKQDQVVLLGEMRPAMPCESYSNAGVNDHRSESRLSIESSTKKIMRRTMRPNDNIFNYGSAGKDGKFSWSRDRDSRIFQGRMRQTDAFRFNNRDKGSHDEISKANLTMLGTS